MGNRPVGLLKNLRPEIQKVSEGERRRAEAFMQEHARGTMTFATEEEARTWWLEKAQEKWARCAACPLNEGRTQVVYGEGDPNAELVIVGEAPGEHEDAQGFPFVGESGVLLRRVVAARSVGLEHIPKFITNTVACRPPQNRKPEKEERAACEPRLKELLSILQPRVILLLGATAAHWFGMREVGVNRGIVPKAKWPELGDGRRHLRAAILTWHPQYVFRQESRVRKKTAFAQFVNDLILTRRAIHQIRREEGR